MTTKRSVCAVAFVGLAVVLAAVGVHSRAGAYGGRAISIDGSWRVTADWFDAMGQPVSVQALATFAYGGGVVETSQERDAVSNGHGAWENLGNRYNDIRVVYFNYDDMGVLIGTTEVRSQVRLNNTGNWFNGRFRTLKLNMDGKLVTDFDGLIEGSRITVD